MARKKKTRKNPTTGKKRRRKRNPGAYLMNPKRRRRRRNPGRMAGDLLSVAAPALIGGGVMGFVDSKFLGTSGTLIRTVVKGGVALGLGTVGRRFFGDVGAKVAMGSVISSIGYEAGVRLGGGMVAMTKQEGVKALIEAAAEDDEIAALIEQAAEGQEEEVGDEGDDIEGATEDAIIKMESQAARQDEIGDEMIAEEGEYVD